MTNVNLRGYVVSGTVSETGLSEVVKSFAKDSPDGKPDVAVSPIFDSTDAAAIEKTEDPKLLAAPAAANGNAAAANGSNGANGHHGRRPAGQSANAIKEGLIGLAHPIKYAEFKRAMAANLGVSEESIQYHLTRLREDGLFKLEGRMLMPNAKALNRLRSESASEAF